MMHSLMMAGPDLRLRGELPQYISLRFKRCFWEVGSFRADGEAGNARLGQPEPGNAAVPAGETRNGAAGGKRSPWTRRRSQSAACP